MCRDVTCNVSTARELIPRRVSGLVQDLSIFTRRAMETDRSEGAKVGS